MRFFSPNIPLGIFFVNLLAISPAVYVTFSSPALAFPCNKAATKTELAICANPKVKQVDDAMGKAYFTMRDNLAQKSVALLKTSQRNWLKYRDFYCQAESACLLDETRNRAVKLTRVSSYQPAMVPVFRWQSGGKNAYAIKFEGVKFASPNTTEQSSGRLAFNREVDNVITEAPWGKTTEDQFLGPWERETILSITALSDRMISATAATYGFSGGAHPNTWSRSININLKTGQPMTTTGLFSGPSIKMLVSGCRDRISEVKSDRSGISIKEARADIEASYPSALKSHVLDMTRWRFNDKDVSINFDTYAISSYAEGPYSCEFSRKYIIDLASNPELLQR